MDSGERNATQQIVQPVSTLVDFVCPAAEANLTGSHPVLLDFPLPSLPPPTPSPPSPSRHHAPPPPRRTRPAPLTRSHPPGPIPRKPDLPARLSPTAEGRRILPRPGRRRPRVFLDVGRGRVDDLVCCTGQVLARSVGRCCIRGGVGRCSRGTPISPPSHLTRQLTPSHHQILFFLYQRYITSIIQRPAPPSTLTPEECRAFFIKMLQTGLHDAAAEDDDAAGHAESIPSATEIHNRLTDAIDLARTDPSCTEPAEDDARSSATTAVDTSSPTLRHRKPSAAHAHARQAHTHTHTHGTASPMVTLHRLSPDDPRAIEFREKMRNWYAPPPLPLLFHPFQNSPHPTPPCLRKGSAARPGTPSPVPPSFTGSPGHAATCPSMTSPAVPSK